MRSIIFGIVAVLAGWWLTGCEKSESAVGSRPGGSTAAASGPISFNASIQPILSDNCYHCHGPDSGARQPEKEPLRLDREKFAFQPREDGKPVMIKGDAGASLLVQLIKSKDPDEIMPPPKSHKTLTPEQIATIERWVAEGAVYQEHWSFIPPVKAPLPALADPGSVRNPIDAFVRAKLAENGLEPMPAEDPRVLIRRASLDLTGLLPAPADVEAFAKNPSDAAYDAYLDKLFASPAYAEHRTRYWLDYSRYADTHGLHFDNVRSIWPYRDYVIRSFAANKPYDQFVREQVAGDLIPAPNADTWIATGYIRCNVSTNEGGSIPEEVHANNTRDRTEAFGAAFLGLTVQCAACHDHKFDPTAQKDFYSLAAFFNNTAEKPWDENIADTQPVLRLPADDKKAEFDALVAKRSQAAVALQKRRADAPRLFREWIASGQHPEPVNPDKLELRLRLDEGSGDVVKNSAPAVKSMTYKADTNPLVWGENVWLWPSMRMEIASNLPMPDQGDFEWDQPFSGSMWVMLRLKPANITTGNGSLMSRMGDDKMDAHRGWDMFIDNDQFAVHLVSQWPNAAIRVNTPGIPRGEWVHLAFTYDGSGKAEGIKLYVNGEPREAKASTNTLQPGQTIRNPRKFQLGQRDGGSDRLRETAFQDVRIYKRTLDPSECSKLPFEDLTAEIASTQTDPDKWSSQQKFIGLDGFFLKSKDQEAVRLRSEIAKADSELMALGSKGTPTLIARERPAPASAWILNRGVYSSRKELVEPATPEFLPAPGVAKDRLQLVDWLCRPENPLFARVTVNRMWQEIFGTGIVETSEDFGIMGSRPSNQALLDWLAVEFRESGWNVQHMYRLMLTSATYRQSNHVTPAALAADPQNRLLSRGPRFRMDAEVLRDTALQAAGLLAAKIGGPPVKPYQPEGVWEAVSMPESNTLKYKQDDGEALYRRSLYTFWKRFSPPPSLETFDAQARETVCMRRARTNTPLQALVSMNDPQFVEAARKLAERTIAAGQSTAERMAFLAATLISRPLAPKESANLEKNLGVFSKYYLEHPQDAKELLTTGAAPARTDIDPLELATWAMMANQFMNLDETITK